MKSNSKKCKCGGNFKEINTFSVIHKENKRPFIYATYECTKCKLCLSKSKN